MRCPCIRAGKYGNRVKCLKPVVVVYRYHWDTGVTTQTFRCNLHKDQSLYMSKTDSRLETVTLEEYQLYKIKEAL